MINSIKSTQSSLMMSSATGLLKWFPKISCVLVKIMYTTYLIMAFTIHAKESYGSSSTVESSLKVHPWMILKFLDRSASTVQARAHHLYVWGKNPYFIKSEWQRRTRTFFDSYGGLMKIWIRKLQSTEWPCIYLGQCHQQLCMLWGGWQMAIKAAFLMRWKAQKFLCGWLFKKLRVCGESSGDGLWRQYPLP